MADEPTTTQPAGVQASQESAAATPGTEQLGEPGKAALEAERKARRDADRQLKDALAKLQAFEDRDKTEAQKAADAVQAAKAERDTALAEAARFRAAAKHKLTEEDLALLDGIPADQIEDRAAKLAARLAPPKPDDTAAKGAIGPYVPMEGTNPGKPVAASLGQQFADFLTKQQTTAR